VNGREDLERVVGPGALVILLLGLLFVAGGFGTFVAGHMEGLLLAFVGVAMSRAGWVGSQAESSTRSCKQSSSASPPPVAPSRASDRHLASDLADCSLTFTLHQALSRRIVMECEGHASLCKGN